MMMDIMVEQDAATKRRKEPPAASSPENMPIFLAGCLFIDPN
jgi:hypothetical protein